MSWTLLVGVVLVLGAGMLAALARRAELVRMGHAVAARERGERLSQGAQLYKPAIDLGRCMGCGTCVSACPEDVLELVHGQAAIVHPARCEGIAACERECPVGAIEVGIADLDERDDVPVVSPSLEAVGVPGLFLAGEVTAQALIKTAVEHGTRVAREAAKRPAPLDPTLEQVPSLAAIAERRAEEARVAAEDASESWLLGDELAGDGEGELVEEEAAVDEAPLDLLIVGAGPAGLACALEAKRLGMTARVLERESAPGGTVARYPRKKLVLTQPVELPLHGALDDKSYVKEDLIELWNDVIATNELDIATGEVFTGLERRDDGTFDVTTESGGHRANNVCLAIGRRGLPRRLGVPGEELPKVAYGLLDAASYQDVAALVVGGGDSAVETALALAEQPGNKVTLSYRKEAFFRLRGRNAERLEQARAAGELDVVLESEVEKITEHGVHLSLRGGDDRVVANDHVFVQIGGTAPTEVLDRSGVSRDPELRAAQRAAANEVEGEDDTQAAEVEQAGLAKSLKVGFGLAVACLLWAVWNLDYYALPLPARPAHEMHPWLRPGLGVGLAFGVIALVLIVVNLAYLLRRSPSIPLERGSLQAWMTSHVATGIFAVLCALLHAAMAPKETVGGQAFWSLVALLVTGAIGRWLYAWVPRAANGRELELDEVRAWLHRDELGWSEAQRDFQKRARTAVIELIDDRQWRDTFTGRLVAMIGLRFDLAKTLGELRREGRELGVPDDQIKDTLALARRAHRLALVAGHFEDVRAALGSWRYLHRWIAVLMVMLVVLHVVNALSYSAFFTDGGLD